MDKCRKIWSEKDEDLGDFAELDLALRRFEWLAMGLALFFFVRAVLIAFQYQDVLRAYEYGHFAYVPPIVSEYMSVSRIVAYLLEIICISMLFRLLVRRWIFWRKRREEEDEKQ